MGIYVGRIGSPRNIGTIIYETQIPHENLRQPGGDFFIFMQGIASLAKKVVFLSEEQILSQALMCYLLSYVLPQCICIGAANPLCYAP